MNQDRLVKWLAELVNEEQRIGSTIRARSVDGQDLIVHVGYGRYFRVSVQPVPAEAVDETAREFRAARS